MENEKKWLTSDNRIFAFQHGKMHIGTMEIALGTSKRRAIANFEGRTIVIAKTGFWKRNIEIKDQKGQLIAKLYPEKWYSGSFIMEYGNKMYKLLLRNNPLAEWVIQYNNKDLLGYGLGTENGKPGVNITENSFNGDYLFDFILWYLFLPIATEEMADDYTFLLLATA